MPAETRPLAGRLRLLRASVLGTASLLLGTGAHLAGGGTLPGPGVLLVAGTVLALGAALLTARRCGPALLLGVLGVEQVLLHLLLGLAAAARACTVPAVAGHAAMATGRVVGACPAPGGMAMSGALPGWAMLAAHVAATLLTAWLLARGEAWCWRFVDRVVDAAALRVRRRRPARRRGARVAFRPAPLGRTSAWSPAAPRGPPLRATA